jgi:hypothetical protein
MIGYVMGVSRYYDGSSRYMREVHGGKKEFTHCDIAVDVAVLWDCIYKNILACH